MSRRLFWLGLDGADENTVGRLAADGRLPQITSRIRGNLRRLPSTVFPITPAAWTSAYTGMNPGKTGILTWQQLNSGYRARIVNAADIGDRSLFSRIGDAGKAIVSIGFPMTAPIQRTAGALIFPGWDSPPDSPRCSDASWAARLESFGYRTADEFNPDEAVLAENVRAHFRLAKALTNESHWDCLGIYFAFIDTLGHKLGAGNERTLRLVELVDSELGKFLGSLPFSVEFLVNSDHGFGGFTRAFSPIQWLEEHGYLTLTSRFVRDRIDAQPGLEFMDFHDSAIDWKATKAFCVDTVGSYAGLHLNVRGKFDMGIVDPREAWKLAEEIRAALLETRDDRGRPLVRNVWRREERFWGPCVERLPELILETAPNTVALVGKRSRVGDVYEFAKGYVHDGTFHSHLPDGVWGSSFDVLADPAIEDVAPTIYGVLGIPLPDDIDGRNVSEFTVGTRNVAQREQDEPSRAYSAEEEEVVRQRLEALGYLG